MSGTEICEELRFSNFLGAFLLRVAELRLKLVYAYGCTELLKSSLSKLVIRCVGSLVNFR